jgi:predicted metal-dependent peptidase
MIIKNIHEKLMESIQIMLIDIKYNLPFYGNYNLFINFSERKDLPTCAVNMTTTGMNFYYNSEFLNGLSQKEVNFITLHEDFHLLWNHPKRTITGQYDHKLANIAQDMIINHVIVEDISDTFIEIPKDKEGRNMALFVPKEYTGKLIFEELYEWLRDKQEEHQKNKGKSKSEQSSGGGSKGDKQDSEGSKGEKQDGGSKGDKQDGDGQEQEGSGEGTGEKSDKYGPYGKNPKKEGETIDTYSLDQLFDNLDETEGQYMDSHMTDEIPEEMRDSIIKDAIERLQARGFSSGNIEQTLTKLRKKRKDYLSHIKRQVSNIIFGTRKMKTIVKPNRRQISGLKGNRKVKTKINVLLDTSGSMSGLFSKVLEYVFQNDIEINLIQSDTEVKWVKTLKSKKQIESIPIVGLGGTVLQPMIDYLVEHHNDCNSVLLSDGYTDSLDFSKVKGRVLIISAGVPCPIAKSNGKLKQICIENPH